MEGDPTGGRYVASLGGGDDPEAKKRGKIYERLNDRTMTHCYSYIPRQIHDTLKTGMIILLLTCITTACRTDDIEPDHYPDIPNVGTPAQKALDSIYMYAHEVWLWQEYLPNYAEANLRQHASAGVPQAYRNALFSLLAPVLNPLTSQPFEKEMGNLQLKYSYLGNPVVHSGQRTALSSAGTADDMGFEAGQHRGDDVRVAYVNPQSPADRAGIRRGDRILKVNGRAVSEVQRVNQALSTSVTTLELQKQDGSLQQTTLYRSPYTSHAIYRYTIIDLRYNLGGYVSPVRQLANLIAPAALDGKTMYSEHYTAIMQQGKASILVNQPYFDSKGEAVYIGNRRATYLDVDFSIAGNTHRFENTGSSGNVQRLYFIVSGNTASAAEMLINILKPHLPVRIAGATTYGKPVGFFGINLSGYTLYLSSFLIRNSEGRADYSDGLVPDIPATDDLGYDFGDLREASLSAVLDDLSGRPRHQGSARLSTRTGVPPRERAFHVSGFRGMLKDDSGLKK